MPLFDSTAPDITESIPATISARRVAAVYANRGVKFDIAIGGLPFVLAPTDSNPYQRQTADPAKQQLDTSKEAGEQTLSQWWTRSQDSWHRGEGIIFYEPGSEDGTQYRYGHSVGVDVWQQGQVTLLNRMDAVASVVTGQKAYVVTGGTGVYYSLEHQTLRRRTASTSVTYTNSGTVPTTAPCVAGSNILIGHTAGIDIGTSSGSTLTRLYSNSGGVEVRPWWAKSRIIATRGPDLFELAVAPASPPVALGTPLYTHPVSTWQWMAVADSPGAILAAGSSDGQSAIYRFALEDAGSGATPQLGQAYQVAEFPPGETVTAMRVYLGQYVAIGTSRGLRVGIVSADGTLQYGPLIVETTSPVLDLAARDSYIYAAVTNAIDGLSGAVRVNLGEEIDDLRYAYAWDAQAHVSGNCTGVAFLGNTDRVVLGVEGHGVYLQSADRYEPTGYVTSGRIRFATSELKSFRRVRVNARASAGTGVSVLIRDNRDSERFVFKINSTNGDGIDLGLSADTPLPNASIRLILEANDDADQTPVLDALLVKALPAVRRQRLVQYPLSVFDRVKDRWNNETVVENGAALRLFALEELESSQATVIVQDFRTGEAYEGQIQTQEFTNTTPPDRVSSGFGGIVNVVIRRLV